MSCTHQGNADECIAGKSILQPCHDVLNLFRLYLRTIQINQAKSKYLSMTLTNTAIRSTDWRLQSTCVLHNSDCQLLLRQVEITDPEIDITHTHGNGCNQGTYSRVCVASLSAHFNGIQITLQNCQKTLFTHMDIYIICCKYLVVSNGALSY